MQTDTVYQLVYISAATHDFTEPELEILLAKARANNERLNITGMLLYHDGSFIQALEGEKSRVEQLYKQIAADSRHIETRVLYRGFQDQRSFEGWSMGFYRSRQSASENLEGFHQFLEKGFRRHAFQPDNIARRALLAFREGKWRQHASA
ncbi:MAG: BLUF domain-containing protein [Gammaproteobacteria bacterium]|nr:BLUF domain-containing protein [Gammaproteobacteria bacterium]